MSNTLQKYNNDISELVNENGMDGMPNEHEGFRTNASSKGGLALLGSNSKNNELSNKKWAEELTKADDRASNFQHQYLIENKKRREVEDRMETLEKQITIREEEIKRLHNLYEGGQNLEKLNVRFVHETNERTIAKLQNQLDFVNKENHRLSQQLDFIRGGKTMVDEFEQLKTQIKELEFENDCLKRDIRESSKLIKDYQEKDLEH